MRLYILYCESLLISYIQELVLFFNTSTGTQLFWDTFCANTPFYCHNGVEICIPINSVNHEALKERLKLNQ